MKRWILLFSLVFLLGGCSWVEPEQRDDQHSLVEDYVRANIGSLSPVEPVLGGSWYVLSVDFAENDHVHVVYEDGHIQESFDAQFAVDASGNVSLVVE